MIDSLTFEIIKRVVADLGAVPGPDFGKVGLTDPGLLLAKTLTVRYDEKTNAEHSIYAGKLVFRDSSKTSSMRGLLVNLTMDASEGHLNEPYYEFLFVFRMDDMPIHTIKVVYDDPSESFIRIYNEDKDRWIRPSMYMKARILADFERIVSWGIMWEDCKEVSDLYDIAVKLVNN